jgi:peroxiredoxin
VQLGKLQNRLNEIEGAGAAVFAISIDKPDDARALRRELGLTFPMLSDPDMRVIRAFDMKGEAMKMADMGYVIVDRQGRIRTKRIDRYFGDNIGMIRDAVLAATRDGS